MGMRKDHPRSAQKTVFRPHLFAQCSAHGAAQIECPRAYSKEVKWREAIIYIIKCKLFLNFAK
jgi:hypothetical protein